MVTRDYRCAIAGPIMVLDSCPRPRICAFCQACFFPSE
ncbi:hypothetical protein RSAG8_11883, partial [Rhizoctonia solani AG-8 WAC10335]